MKRIPKFTSDQMSCYRCGRGNLCTYHVVVPFASSKEVEVRRGVEYKIKNVWLCNRCLNTLKALIRSWATTGPRPKMKYTGRY